MPNECYLTIQEFAEAAGITPQRVSQLLRKSLKQFLIIENGRKYIHSDALPEVIQARERQGYRAQRERVSKEFETVSSSRIDELTAKLDAVRAELDDTRADLHAAELKAAAAEAAADAERRHSDEQAAALRAALDALQAAQTHAETLATALQAAQALHAGTIRGQLDTVHGDAVTGNQGDAGSSFSSAPMPKPEPAEGAATIRRDHPKKQKPAGADRRAKLSDYVQKSAIFSKIFRQRH